MSTSKSNPGHVLCCATDTGSLLSCLCTWPSAKYVVCVLCFGEKHFLCQIMPLYWSWRPCTHSTSTTAISTMPLALCPTPPTNSRPFCSGKNWPFIFVCFLISCNALFILLLTLITKAQEQTMEVELGEESARIYTCMSVIIMTFSLIALMNSTFPGCFWTGLHCLKMRAMEKCVRN